MRPAPRPSRRSPASTRACRSSSPATTPTSRAGWAVVKDGKKLEIVRSPEFAAIYWPERVDGCNPYDIGLTAESVPISKTGRFHAKEKIPVAGTEDVLSVDWKGRWTNATKLKGSVKIGLGKCSEKVPYTGGRTGPVPGS